MGRSRQGKRLLSGFGLEFIGGFAAANRYPSRIEDSSSRKAASFSSARTMKRFPSPPWASAMKIVRLLESSAERQPDEAITIFETFQMIGFGHTVVTKDFR